VKSSDVVSVMVIRVLDGLKQVDVRTCMSRGKISAYGQPLSDVWGWQGTSSIYFSKWSL